MNEDYDEIVNKLHNIYGNDSLIKLLDERATLQEALTKLTAERDALREALEPFARYAEVAYRALGDGATALKTTINGGATVTVGDFWHARDLLKQDNT